MPGLHLHELVGVASRPARRRRTAPRSCASTAPGSARGRCRCAELRRLRPPLRRANGSCSVGWLNSWRNEVASPSKPSSSHMFTTSGHRRVRAHRAPHAVAELVALAPARSAKVRRHVVHVVGAVVPDDVDELVDVDLVVHRVVHAVRFPGRRSVTPRRAELELLDPLRRRVAGERRRRRCSAAP